MVLICMAALHGCSAPDPARALPPKTYSQAEGMLGREVVQGQTLDGELSQELTSMVS